MVFGALPDQGDEMSASSPRASPKWSWTARVLLAQELSRLETQVETGNQVRANGYRMKQEVKDSKMVTESFRWTESQPARPSFAGYVCYMFATFMLQEYCSLTRAKRRVFRASKRFETQCVAKYQTHPDSMKPNHGPSSESGLGAPAKAKHSVRGCRRSCCHSRISAKTRDTKESTLGQDNIGSIRIRWSQISWPNWPGWLFKGLRPTAGQGPTWR